MSNLIKFDRTIEEFVNEFFGYNKPTTFYSTKGLTNVKENEKSYNLELLLPGYSKDETNVEINEDMLKISANVEDTNSKDTEKWTRKEFVKKSFVRTFSIPEDVDKENINADMKDGVLSIILNKKVEEKKQTKIKIM